ncbi:hypothetical protein GGI15_004628 [Coemansia interrupta]|uniref:Uncharacterized protein n=1 Tax=Coemansia interrupta TaxID=1126814 RepID=A0A9W8H6P2_9FUNG|nr:hypothetical protein GGI15_004628 [Coemansia interrupta]
MAMLVYPNSQRTKLRAEPVAELCDFVASCSKPTRLQKAPVPADAKPTLLKRQAASYTSLRRTSRLVDRDTTSSAAAKRPAADKQHERTLLLLKTLLESTARVSSEQRAPEQVACEDSSIILATATLEEKRQALVEMLREMQNPNAENIVTTHSLLCNRAKLGLLDSQSARKHGHAMMRAGNNGAAAAMPIGIATSPLSGDSTLASSLESDASDETLTEADGDSEYDGLEIQLSGNRSGQPPAASATAMGLKASLIDMWANNGGFWRGVSVRSWSTRVSRRASTVSVNTLINAQDSRPADALEVAEAVPDVGGICWALSDALEELAKQSWTRFYASLGGVRVPTRFRTPEHSLNMLACEQLMMRNDKLICPLKNRTQEPNPRRQYFEEYIRTTGTVPPPDSVADRKACSPLRSELY